MTHGPSTARKRERKSQAGAEPWQLEGCVVWPLLYAALGKTSECGASEVSGLPHQDTSSYFYFFYFFLLYIFSGKTYLDLFFNFFLLTFLFLAVTFFLLTFFALFDRGLREQPMVSMYTLYCLLAFLSILAVFP